MKANEKLKFTETAEFRTKIENKAASFEIKSANLKAHFDLSFLAMGKHAINPYMTISIPRSNPNLVPRGITTFGTLIHINPKVPHHKLRANFQLAIFDRENKNDFIVKKNLSWLWRGLQFSAYNEFDATQGRTTDTRISVGYSNTAFNSYIEADFLNLNRFTGVSSGISVVPFKSFRFFGIFNKYFEFQKTAQAYGVEFATWPSLPNQFTAKAVYYPSTMLACKLGYVFNPNLYVALMAEQHLTPHNSKTGLGLQVKIAC